MKLKLTLPIAVFLTLLTVALCTGSQLFLLLSILILLILAGALISVLWASSTLEVDGMLSGETVRRGDDVVLSLRVRHRGFLPVAPLLLELSDPVGNRDREVRLKNMPHRLQSMRLPIHASHVGVFSVGLRSCTVEDLLCLVQRRIPLQKTSFELVVLPQTFDVEPLKLAPGDPGSELMSRATEDLNAPSDIRAYQPGDAMKKIHWKLSARKQELIVRKFEEPLLQEVLILMDCSRPPFHGDSQAEADIRDTLLETAASLFSAQMRTDHEIRMPLTGSRPAEADRSIGTTIALKYLAGVDFSETDRFERVLQMESSRMSKVGCVAVVTARLNYAMVDIMTRIHRTGPNLRLYLVTSTPEDANVLPLISRLQHSEIEVAYVTPNAG